MGEGGRRPGEGIILWFYKYAAPDGALAGTLRGDVPAGAFPSLASGILNSLPAGDRKARAGGRRSAPSLPRRDAENGNRDGRAPQQSPCWWPCASTGQWQFGVDEWGKGRLKSFRAKGAKAAKSRSDAMTIAQSFMAGLNVINTKQVPAGRQKNSFVPDGTWNIPEP
jgi:hypothetical protein